MKIGNLNTQYRSRTQNFNGLVYTEKTIRNVKDAFFGGNRQTEAFLDELLVDIKKRHLSNPFYDIFIADTDGTLNSAQQLNTYTPQIIIKNKAGKPIICLNVQNDANDQYRKLDSDLRFITSLQKADSIASNTPDSIDNFLIHLTEEF